MKLLALLAISTVALSANVFGQEGRRGAPPPPPPLEPGASQADVDRALLAAPGNLKDQATVIKWNADQSYVTLRKGTNRLVCYDRSGFPLQPAFLVECTSIANLDRVKQNIKAEALGDRMKSEMMLNDLEKSGSRVKPEFGSIWYHLEGADKDRARMHTTVAVPGATSQSMGLPDNPRQGGMWIMNAGTSTAHLMIPGE